MPIRVTPRAVEVLRRAFDAGRLDPSVHAIRLRMVRGLGGDQIQTGFADSRDEGELEISSGGITLYVPAELAERGATIDVSAEHDTIVVR